MTRYLPRLRLPIISVVFMAAAFSGAFSQNLPQSSDPQLAPAIKLLSERRNEEARKLLEKVLEANEGNAEAWYYLGLVHIQLHDFTKASNAFQQAIKIQPSMAAEVHSRFGFALVVRNQLAHAEQEAQKALSADPKNVLALHTLGLVNLRSEARDEAIKHADAVIALAPDFAESYLVKSQATMILSATDRSPNLEETRRNQRLRYREATTALASYVKLLTNARDVEFWREQLKTLEFYASDGAAEIYSGRDITAKARLLSKPEPSYTEDARVDGIEGTVILKCVFAEDGTVKHILVTRYLPGGLTEAALAAARKIRFNPGTIDGKPVSMYMQLEYNFNLF